MHVRVLILVLSLPLLLLGCNNAAGDVSTRGADDVQPTAVNLAIEGMTCEGCVSAIEDTVKRIEGVTSCEVSLEEGIALVRVADADVLPTVINRIEKMKYQARVVDEGAGKGE